MERETFSEKVSIMDRNPTKRLAWVKRFIEGGQTYAASVSAIGDTSYFLGLFNGETTLSDETFDAPAQLILTENSSVGEIINAWSLIQYPGRREQLVISDLQAIDVDRVRRFYSIVGFSGDISIFSNQRVNSIGTGNELFLVTDRRPRIIFYHHLSGTQSNSQLISDKNGNSYVIGSFNRVLLLDGKEILTSTLKSDSFILKFDPMGRIVWYIKGGGTEQTTGRDIAIIQSGGNSLTSMNIGGKDLSDETGGESPDLLVAVGTFMDTITLGNTVLKNNSAWFTSWVGILTSEGNWVKAFSIKANPESSIDHSQPEYLTMERVTTDDLGNIYTIGESSGTFMFGKKMILSLKPIGIFVAKWSPTGNLIWLRNVLTKIPPNNGIFPRLVTDKLGNSFVSGYSWNGLKLESEKQSIDVDGSGSIDFFLAQLSPDGNWLWSFIFPGIIDSPSNLTAVGNPSAVSGINYVSRNVPNSTESGINSEKNTEIITHELNQTTLFAAGINLVNSTQRDAFISRLFTDSSTEDLI